MECQACQDVGDMSRLSDIPITLAEALNPSAVGVKLKSFGEGNTIDGDQQAAIQAYLTLCRSVEEIDMLKDDALNLVKYYEQARDIVYDKLGSLSSQADSFSRGSTSLLHHLLADINNHLKQGHLLVQTMTKSSEGDNGQLLQDSDSFSEDEFDSFNEDEF